MSPTAISKTPTNRRSGCGTVFAGLGLSFSIAIGSAAGYFLSFRPLYHLIEAQSWTPRPCVVVSSRIESGEGTARADIVYRYTVDDREYTASRYNFNPGTTADSSVPAAVASHPPGKRFECYVDPDDPRRAVINRSHSLWYHIGTPFFVLFGLLPLGIGFVIFRSHRTEDAAAKALVAARPAANDPRFGHAPAVDTGPVVLKPSASPMFKVVGLGAICLFWNFVVGIFTVVEYWMYSTGEAGWWIMGLFLLLFQAVGVFLIWAVIKQVLALGNPRPVLTLSRAVVPVGGSVAFGWQLTGKAHRVTHLQMTLKGTEEATYRRGTDTHTDKHEFFSESLVDVSHATGIARGTGTIRIPRDTMHTFSADHNKVIWTLVVAGTIARWPDIEDAFEIKVGPA
jgi:hypothetical protein